MGVGFKRTKSGTNTTLTIRKDGKTTKTTSTSTGTGRRIAFTRKSDGRQVQTETFRSSDGYTYRSSKTLSNPNKKQKVKKPPKPPKIKFPKVTKVKMPKFSKAPKIKMARALRARHSTPMSVASTFFWTFLIIILLALSK